MFKIQPYDIIIKYNPGPTVPVIDVLSRVNPSRKTYVMVLNNTIHEITFQPKMHVKVQEIKQTTKIAPDTATSNAEGYGSWPKYKISVILQPFWQIKEDLAIEYTCITFQGKFYIPFSMRKECLHAPCKGHLGITKMKLTVKSITFLINI